MKYLIFGAVEKSSYKICILVPQLHKNDILRYYIQPYGLDPEDVIAISLHRSADKKKTPADEMKAYINDELAPIFKDMGVQYLLVGDGDYFKTLTGAGKVDAFFGYVMESKLIPQRMAYVPNFQIMFRDPSGVTSKIAMGVNAMKTWIDGTYKDPGHGIIEFAEYPDTVEEVDIWLTQLLTRPSLTCDIEGFGLKHYDSGIGTITFCWSKSSGIAFPVDYQGDHVYAFRVRALLARFFEEYKGRLIFHKIDFDVTVLIYQLYMKHLLDNEGLLRGLEIMLKNWDCTRIIAYLATNSCAGNHLSLKIQAQEWCGNYAQEDIKDIRKIPLPTLLQYNLVDGLGTWFTYDKHWDTLVNDQQLEIYETIFKPAMRDIIQMQLTGMPVDMNQVLVVEDILNVIMNDAIRQILANAEIGLFTHNLREEHVRKRNAALKNKRITMADDEVAAVVFNPRSPDQLQELLFEQLALPVLSYTKTKQPETGGDVLTALRNHTQNPAAIDLLEALISFKAVDKILGTFIKALKSSQLGNDGWYYLFGNFNLGGTVSGRLSSSGPNLQNLPANVEMLISTAIAKILGDRISKFVKKGKLHLGKLIKSCFKAPPGWFFCGIDFASLEDRISALTTKDPNKLKVYTDGYDGHSLRAHSYFGDQMIGIDPTSVESINAIAKSYPAFRQDSKVPTFLLTYGGTYMGIMEQMGWDKSKAQLIEARYHELYKISDLWVKSKIDQACVDGFITAAFGLRVRTPLLHQVIRGTGKTPFQAEAEGRTAGNALGQSWCLLNSRAGSEFMGKVRTSEFRHDIKPCAQIHDANYMLVRDNIDAVRYANEHIVKACEWQDHPDIEHPEVKLGGEFSIFYPTWADEVGIPNGASSKETYAAFEQYIYKLNEKKAA